MLSGPLRKLEIDPDQPRIEKAGLKSRFRHYNNLHKTRRRFLRLLKDFKNIEILFLNCT